MYMIGPDDFFDKNPRTIWLKTIWFKKYVTPEN